MDYRLKDAVFLVTGGARGIGAATAALAAQEGARIAIADINREVAEVTVQELRSTGAEAEYFYCDITSPESTTSLAAEVADRFGGIDVVFNSAGVSDAMLTDRLKLDQLAVDVWDRVFAINVRGAFLLAQATYPHLVKSDRASLINVASVGSHVAFQNTIAYGASKGAVALLTKNLALELARDGIRVNAVCPAVIETDMAREYFASTGDPEGHRRELASTHLVGRLGQPFDIANAVVFLASPNAEFITGAVWLVDGGQLAWRGAWE